jgi:chemotaxis protein methyltransferase CheR
MTAMSLELSDRHFKKVSQIVYRHCGINLKDGKEALVRARLMKRLRVLKLNSIDAYLDLISAKEGTAELERMIDVMTTNKTSFFREAEHFRFLQEEVLPQADLNKLRIWCAACSSGEEPYTLGIVLREAIQQIDRRDILILATDISTTVLQKAVSGVYQGNTLKDAPKALVNRYFSRCLNGANERSYRVNESVKRLIRFGQLNLLESWPMRGPFDVIFCRNVMIYFDRQTQERLINRFYDYIKPGGYLFVGHSEGLSSVSHNFQYVRPATYRK